MPERYIRAVADHYRINQERSRARDFSRAARRLRAMIKKYNPDTDPSLLDPVEGAPMITRLENIWAQAGALILQDEIINLFFADLPEIDRQERESLSLVKEIGPEGVDKIPPITIGQIERAIGEVNRNAEAAP